LEDSILLRMLDSRVLGRNTLAIRDYLHHNLISVKTRRHYKDKPL
jgi:hypothetical protein